jgi:hypothetical protein
MGSADRPQTGRTFLPSPSCLHLAPQGRSHQCENSEITDGPSTNSSSRLVTPTNREDEQPNRTVTAGVAHPPGSSDLSSSQGSPGSLPGLCGVSAVNGRTGVKHAESVRYLRLRRIAGPVLRTRHGTSTATAAHSRAYFQCTRIHSMAHSRARIQSQPPPRPRPPPLPTTGRRRRVRLRACALRSVWICIQSANASSRR